MWGGGRILYHNVVDDDDGDDGDDDDDADQRFTPNLTCPASRSVAIQGSRQDGVKASKGSTGMERAPATVQEAQNCRWPILHDICRLTGFGYAGNLAVNQL